jgi:hypothetical protein
MMVTDDNERYLRWLEYMWDVHKFDPHGTTQREERRTEEILEMFNALGELSKSMLDPPESPPREPS